MTDQPEWEIYTFGEQTVIISLRKDKRTTRRARKRDKQDFKAREPYPEKYGFDNEFFPKLFDVLDIRIGKKNVVFVLGRKARNNVVSLVAEDGTILAAYLETNKKGELHLHKGKAQKLQKYPKTGRKLFWQFAY